VSPSTPWSAPASPSSTCSPHHHGRPRAAGRHRRHRGRAPCFGLGSDRRRHGRAAVHLPGLALPERAVQPRDADDRRSLAFTLAVVGLLESLLTAQLIDDITDTRSDKDRESRGQGIANVATGLLGGMAGCAMIGQSMINVKSGGRTRLSTLARHVPPALILVAGDLVAAIPMAALVAVMIVVAVATFDWNERQAIDHQLDARAPRQRSWWSPSPSSSSPTTSPSACWPASCSRPSSSPGASPTSSRSPASSIPTTRCAIYHVTGELFFASTNELVHAFDYDDDTPRVVIDLTDAHVWDTSAVAVLDTIVHKFEIGLNDHSHALHDGLTGRLATSH
jgi:sulfate permease, SulP family